MKKELNKIHQAIFTSKPEAYYFSPGRVNLIGEHTDYSGGHVLPMALDIGTYAAVSRREDRHIHIYSENFSDFGTHVITPDDLDYRKDAGYLNYIKGMLYKFRHERHVIDQGLNISIFGNLPTSAGLSSSASLEILIAIILADQNHLSIAPLKLVRYAKYVENVYLGLSSGIMDQYVITFAEADAAVFLNTKTHTHTLIPFNLTDHTLVLMNTNKKRDLVETHYNDRVRCVETGTRCIKETRPIETLCDLDTSSFQQIRHCVKDPVVLRCIEHVIFENDRTIQAAEALKEGDFELFGNYMNQSHESLKNLFKVSCDELDYLVEHNLELGSLGARMTGAGFGGTMIALYANNQLPADFDALSAAYLKRFDKPLEIIVARPSGGARKLKGAF